MEKNGYEAMSSEKTIVMKHKGSQYIIHGLFVDDMMHIYSSDAMKDEFLALYTKDFEITGDGDGQMETFLGMAVQQKDKSIRMHLDNYIKDVLTEYSDYIKTAQRPKKVPNSPGVVFKAEDIPEPECPDPHRQKKYRSFFAKLQFAATWIRFDISFVVSQLARFCASAG